MAGWTRAPWAVEMAEDTGKRPASGASEAGPGIRRDSRRAFRGSENYVRFFNSQVQARHPVVLEVDSNVPNRHDAHAVGTRWTGPEKDKFFRALARYSVHNLDAVVAETGKSEVDVLNYYHTLRAESQRMKRSKSKLHKMVRMDEIPIAYEMSSSFVRMEETQAHAMAALERRRLIDIKRHRGGTLVDHDDRMMNITWARQISDFLSTTPFNDSKESPPQLVAESYEALEALVGLVTRKIFLDVVNTAYVVRPDRLSTETGTLDLVVRDSDVHRSFQRLFPGHPTRHRDVWFKTAWKMNLDVVNQRQEYAKLYSESEFGRKRKVDVDIDGIESQTSSDEEPAAPAEIDIRHLNSDRRQKRHQTAPRNSFVEGDDDGIIDNPLAEQLFMEEARYLNDSDLNESRNHEHIVLTYLSTYRTPELLEDEQMKQEYFAYEDDVDSREPGARDCYETDDDTELGVDADGADDGLSDVSLDDDDRALLAAERSSAEIAAPTTTPEMLTLHLYDFASYT